MKLRHIILAGTLLPTFALADDGSGVTIYGKVAATLSNNKTYASSTTPGTGSVQTVDDSTSRIGFKGTENLGNGVSAIWQVENRIYVDGSSSSTLASRDTFVGLQVENLGKIRFGRLSNYANLDMELYDLGIYGGVAGTGSYTERLDGRVNNAIRYDSPNWAGFSFTTLLGLDETRRTTSSVGATNNQTANLGLSYENSGFITRFNYLSKGDALKVNQITQQDTNPSSSSLKNWWRLETGYINDQLTIIGGFQKINGYLGVNTSSQFVDSTGVVYNVTALNKQLQQSGRSLSSSDANSLVTTKEAFITAGYTIGKLQPYVEFAKGYNISLGGSSVSNTGYNQYVLGSVYNLSKSTSVAIAYGYVKWAGGIANENSLSVGLSKSF